MDKITMTAAELETIEQELRRLEGEGRTDIAARIKTAREWGDLKENAEYHAAKEEQAHLETRIAKLRHQIRSATVIEPTGATDVVEHGATVTFTDRDTNRAQTFKLVSAHEANPSAGTLSAASPLARALIGHRVGDSVQVQTPRGVRKLSIDAITAL